MDYDELVRDALNERLKTKIGCIVFDPSIEELDAAGAAALSAMEKGVMKPSNRTAPGYMGLVFAFGRCASRHAPEKLVKLFMWSPSSVRAEIGRMLNWPECRDFPREHRAILYQELLKGGAEERQWAAVLKQNFSD